MENFYHCFAFVSLVASHQINFSFFVCVTYFYCNSSSLFCLSKNSLGCIKSRTEWIRWIELSNPPASRLSWSMYIMCAELYPFHPLPLHFSRCQISSFHHFGLPVLRVSSPSAFRGFFTLLPFHSLSPLLYLFILSVSSLRLSWIL